MADFNDFDDFDFKPVTKGLGFHHGEKKDARKFNRTGALEKNAERKRVITRPEQVSTSSSSISRNDLSSFYNSSVEKNVTPELAVSALTQETENITKKFTNAPIILRLLAWVADISIVTMLMGITLLGFFFLLGKDVNEVQSMLSLYDYAAFGLIFFVVFYISYFSVLDLNGSLGKSIFGLTVRAEKGNVSLNQTLLRSVVTLVSFIFLFFPVLIDFHGKVSNTKVVRK